MSDSHTHKALLDVLASLQQKIASIAPAPAPEPSGEAPTPSVWPSILKLAFLDAAAFGGGPQGGAQGGAQGGMPMDPAMMGGQGGMPMDPSMMDPAMMGGQGGMPMDPSMMDPSMMDPAMMGGAPPGDPAAAQGGQSAPPPESGGAPGSNDQLSSLMQTMGFPPGGQYGPEMTPKMNMEVSMLLVLRMLAAVVDFIKAPMPLTSMFPMPHETSVLPQQAPKQPKQQAAGGGGGAFPPIEPIQPLGQQKAADHDSALDEIARLAIQLKMLDERKKD